MQPFRAVNAVQFDAALARYHAGDEHEFLESRYLDASGRVFAKVVRYLDESGILKPEADLLLLETLAGLFTEGQGL